MSMNVPKIIWQTHNYELNDLPDNFKMTAKTWTNLNPSWEYRYFSHNQRIEAVKKYPDLFTLYQKLRPIYQSDIWRYIVTYEYGGVWADMDSICVKPLDYMLENVDDCEMLAIPKIVGMQGGPYVNLNKEKNTNNCNYAVKQKSDTMKNILDDCILDKTNTRGTWLCFVETVQRSEGVSYNFTAASHDARLKTVFNPVFLVDDYGSSIKYLDFLKKYDLSII